MPRVPRSFLIWADIFRKASGAAKDSVIQALRANYLFATLEEKELAYIATLVYERAYAKDEPVFAQSDRGFGLYLVAEGRIAIRSQHAKGIVEVATLGAGSFFGELALIEEDNIRSASAIPLERSVVIGFFKPDLMDVLERKPQIGVKVLLQLASALGRRLVETTERIPETIEVTSEGTASR